MAFPFAATALGVGGALPGVIDSFTGLFDDSENRAIHARNQSRVRAIDIQNNKIHGDNLKIRSDYNNKKLSALENIDNIQLAADQARGRSRLALDRATRDSMMSDQKDIRRMFQSLGYRQGTMNVGNREALLDYSERATARANQLTRGGDDLITGDYDRRLSQQNAIKQQKETVAARPQYKQYVQSYVPEQYQNNQTERILGAVGGLAGAALSGYTAFDQFKPKTDLDGWPGGSLGGKNALKMGNYNLDQLTFGVPLK